MPGPDLPDLPMVRARARAIYEAVGAIRDLPEEAFTVELEREAYRAMDTFDALAAYHAALIHGETREAAAVLTVMQLLGED